MRAGLRMTARAVLMGKFVLWIRMFSWNGAFLTAGSNLPKASFQAHACHRFTYRRQRTGAPDDAGHAQCN